VRPGGRSGLNAPVAQSRPSTTPAVPAPAIEPVVLHVGRGVGQINFRVRDIKIATADDGLPLFETLEKLQKVLIPALAIRQPGEITLGVGDVNIDEKKVRILGGQHATFLIMLYYALVRRDLQRALLRKNRRAGITLLLRAIPIRGVMRRPELFDLFERTLHFLKAQNVGPFRRNKLQKVFLQHGAQAVDVPGNQFHELRFKFI
jgi:hypothetical protein